MAHLLKLCDGRILRTYGYRGEPMGVRTVLSADGGYPISTRLDDGSILTALYITLSDGVTHSAATRWEA